MDTTRTTTANETGSSAREAALVNATMAWVEAWVYGNARPQVVLGALGRLGAQHAADPAGSAIVARGRRVVAATPFGSVQEF